MLNDRHGRPLVVRETTLPPSSRTHSHYAWPHAGDPSLDDDSVDPFLRKTAAWSWRLLVVGAAIIALLWLVQRLQVIVVPVALATMLAALLLPAVDWLDRRGAPRGGAVAWYFWADSRSSAES